jgi:type II secretory pathway pseudopilin PulG
MRCGLKSQITNRKLQMAGQRGYMLITLMLAFTLIAVAMLAVLPNVKQQLQRDREDELRHRGTMYMRAIQHYYKRMGSYPNRIEDLENSNHVRFLRRRYKDPLSWDPQTRKERDFRVLHLQDVMLNNGPVLGQTPGLGGQSGPGGLQRPGGAQSAFGQMQTAGGLPPPQSGLQNQNNNTASSDSPDSSAGNASGSANPDSSGSGNPNSPNPSAASSGPNPGSPGPNGQTFGGGAIMGVASSNKKDKTIREFNKKTHYYDWYFIYDRSMDTGGLLVGPWQPLSISGGGLGQPIGGSGIGQGMGTQGQPQGFSQPGFGQSQNPASPSPQNPPFQQNPNQSPPDSQ